MTHRWDEPPYAKTCDRAVDAEGNELPRGVTAVDVNTGEVERILFDDRGNPKLAPCGWTFEREVIRMPAPLSLYYRDGGVETGRAETWRDRPPML